MHIDNWDAVKTSNSSWYIQPAHAQREIADMKRHQVLVPIAAAVVAILTAACGTDTNGGPLGSGPTGETSTTTAAEPEDPVPDRPQVNWDSPVVGGVEVTTETAQEVAGAAFDVDVPTLRDGTLL